MKRALHHIAAAAFACPAGGANGPSLQPIRQQRTSTEMDSREIMIKSKQTYRAGIQHSQPLNCALAQELGLISPPGGRMVALPSNRNNRKTRKV